MNLDHYSSQQRSSQLPQSQQQQQQPLQQYQHVLPQQGSLQDFSSADLELSTTHQQYQQQPTTFPPLQAQPEYFQEQIPEQHYMQPLNPPTYVQSQRIPPSSQPPGQYYGASSHPAYMTQESINLSMPQSQRFPNYRVTDQHSNIAFTKQPTTYGASLGPPPQPPQHQYLRPLQQGESHHPTSQMALSLESQYEPVPSLSSTGNPLDESSQQSRFSQTTTSSLYTLQPHIASQLQYDTLQENAQKGPPQPPLNVKRHKRNNSSISSVLHSTAYEDELKSMAHAKVNIPLAELARRIKELEYDTSSLSSSSRLTSQEGSSATFPTSSPLATTEKPQNTKETQRLVFGMVWLLTSCEVSPTAVIPRNRIYARYVQICADNSLSPLSPASFGKLVRILYPTITTRRLGMRGQLKYHYCGIRLKGEQSMQLQLIQKQQQQQQQRSHHRGQSLGSDFATLLQLQSPVRPGIGAVSAAQSPLSTTSSVSYEESPRSTFGGETPTYSAINSPSVLSSFPTSDQLPLVSHMKYVPDLFKLLGLESVATKSYPYTPIELPPIYSYLPKDTDRDIADTLSSLYKVHVNTIFESLRFMQLKRLFSTFNNFNSILSSPVSKLYTADSVIEWVQQCDLLMYKKMVRMLSKLHMQYLMPQENINQLKTIASNYTRTLANSIINSRNSKTFITMKLKMAKHFVNLLNRLIKVIETGSTASRILNDDTEKQVMLQDWQKLNFTEMVSRDVPCADESNLNTLIFILSEEVVKIVETPSDENSSLMQTYANFVGGLPSQFPTVSPRMFLLLSSNLLTSILREISLKSGDGFGAWWIVRCWVDEYLAWIMEVGGFFQDELMTYTTEGQEPKLGDRTDEPQKDEESHQGQTSGATGGQAEEEYDLSCETSIDLLG